MHDHSEEEGDVTSLAAEICVESGSITNNNNANSQSYTPPRPILVGYAFGPKKMSTMGIIMAEASQALPTVIPIPAAVAVPVDSIIGKEEDQQSYHQNFLEGKTTRPFKRKLATEDVVATSMSSSLSFVEPQRTAIDELPSSSRTNVSTESSPLGFKFNGSSASTSTKENNEWQSNKNSSSTSPDFDKMMFRSIGKSSTASIADSTTTVTTSTMPLTVSSTSSLCRVTSHDGNGNRRMCPVRVSFVPLDMDSPLEEQHGGRFDAILHKLTEDILSISKMSSDAPDLKRMAESNHAVGSSRSSNLDDNVSKESLESIVGLSPDESQTQAVQRVNRLNRYKLNHPECCLVDHPSSVQVLMSRSDIAHVLSKCLVGVNTVNGIQVRSPQYELVESKDMGRKLLSKLVNQAPFTYPIMVKPLIAAGTAESHKMAVVLGPSGLECVKTPCLLQEYANHDATLYKVYVLGDVVRVFSRPSLPNLPPINNSSQMPSHRSYIEFDSQRPYPRLSDFGITTKETDDYQNSDNNCCCGIDGIRWEGNEDLPNSYKKSYKRPRTTSPYKQGYTTVVNDQKPKACWWTRMNKFAQTAEEILPVVDALKKAFSLELFGFDILVTHKRTSVHPNKQILSKEEEMEMIVVDVNYFPSYKEVSSFPSMLAQFLTQRAVEGRRTI